MSWQKIMSESSCICCRRQQPFSGPPNYPQWEEGEDNASKLGKHGYLVVKGVLSAAEVDQTKKEISRVVSDWFSTVEQTENAGSDLQEIVNMLAFFLCLIYQQCIHFFLLHSDFLRLKKAKSMLLVILSYLLESFTD